MCLCACARLCVCFAEIKVIGFRLTSQNKHMFVFPNVIFSLMNRTVQTFLKSALLGEFRFSTGTGAYLGGTLCGQGISSLHPAW